MAAVLLTVRAFATYNVGDLITETKNIRDVLSGAHAQDVVRISAPAVAEQKSKEV